MRRRDACERAAELRRHTQPLVRDGVVGLVDARDMAVEPLTHRPERIDEARQFIEFLTSPEGQALYADSIAGIPALDPEYEVDPALEPLMTYMAEGKTDPFMDQLWPNPNVQQVHLEVGQQLLAGDITVEEALARMDEAYAAG